MGRDIDRRDQQVNRLNQSRENKLKSAASEISEHLPGGHQIQIAGFDTSSGNPSTIRSESAPAERNNYVQRALDHLQNIRGALGFQAGQMPEYVADPHVQTSSSGAAVVHVHQRYKGIPIFQAGQTVQFAPDGRLRETTGQSITVDYEQEVLADLSVEEGVMKAAQYVAEPHEDEEGMTDQFGEPMEVPRVDVSGYSPTVLAAFTEDPEQPTVLDAGPFGDRIKANLTWFPLGSELRLAWEVVITMPGYEGQYRTLVDARTGEILYCHQLVQTLMAQGNVYHVDGSGERQNTDFPRPIADYNMSVPEGLPAEFPDDWVDGDQTTGNAVHAHLGDSGSAVQGDLEGNRVIFNPDEPKGDEQKVLNIFYYNCYMHDYFYLLGFREADGNFQQNNFGRGGVKSDRVDARAYSGPVWGTASMATPVDGARPTMRMGLVTSTSRHTAFDSTVVFHEFMHGVTNRLVGGPMNSRALEAIQSRGMGEGWSDFIACMVNETNVVGAWVVDDPGGIRGFPYTSEFPDHFGKLGTDRYTTVHNIGEIWCATLVEMAGNVGKNLTMQLVVDALKLSPPNPSFLNMRDAIFSALLSKREAGQLTTDEYTSAHTGMWKAFGKFGMGPAATSNGASLSGIAPDFTVPSEVAEEHVQQVTEPNLQIPDDDPTGVTSTVTVAEEGRISRLRVELDIKHTYRGDLRVSLTSPAGSEVILHERTGDSEQDLIRSYSSEESAELSTLVGEDLAGEWSLTVADLAGKDTGTLRSWGLEIHYDVEVEDEEGDTRKEVSPAVTIPDNDPEGVTSVITISTAGTVGDIAVGVDITHSFISDLRVVLVNPAGQSVVLHDRSGGSRDNLITTYDTEHTEGLAALRGQPGEGDWTLRVSDLARRDAGKLNKWSLDLTYSST